jgi:Tfp pilus assembly protein PilN
MDCELSGIVPAVVTPMNEAGEFLPKSYERLCASLYAAGVEGLYVCGQTGEGLQQSPEQRKRVAEAELKIAQLTRQLQKLDTTLGDGTLFASDPTRAAELSKTRANVVAAIAQAEEDWLAASSALETA